MIDTHCHLHDKEFFSENREQVYEQCIKKGINAMICIGTNVQDSHEAARFAATHDRAYAAIGVHPHDAKDGIDGLEKLVSEEKVVAIGEIGLDYFYDNSPRDVQQDVLRKQLAIAQKHNLPVSFHVREAFDDFWPIFDEFPGIRGVLHSFTDTWDNAQAAINRGLYIGINGISTFTKDEKQKKMFASLPLDVIVLETDAPFLTPVPFRGKQNIPVYVREIAAFHASQRNTSIEKVLDITTGNAMSVFNLRSV